MSKCKVCKSEYIRKSLAHTCCSTECAIEYAKRLSTKRLEQEAREARKEIRERKDKLKTRSDWLREAQTVFNAYIRARDRANNYPCISCGRHHAGDMHAGHYRSIGAAPHLRFNEDNVHLQCAPCNTYKSGNAIEYRISLVKRIGEERVTRLETDQSVCKLTIDDAKRIKSEYKRKLKEL